jgi:predicted transcriptional regulator
MPDDVAIEARIPTELNDALTRLAVARRKRKSTLVREALREYILSEEAFAAAVEEGRAAVRAGDIIDHAEVIRQIDALLARKA